MGKAEQTRHHILEKAFHMIYQHGYQATSIDKIIEKTEVTKGAFYYHFKNKDEMGIAIIREIIKPKLEKGLWRALEDAQHPIQVIYNAIEQKITTDTDYEVDHGCPTNNLVQEMGSINLQFYKSLRSVLDTWVLTIEKVFDKGKVNGQIREDVNSKAAAQFIVSGYEGMKGLGKIYGREFYGSYLSQLKAYLESLN